MVRRVFIFITICAIFYIQCAGPLGTRKALPQLDPEELLRDITAHASRLQTFRGMATLSVVSSLGPFRGTLQILVKMPDSLWIKVEGPLGLDLLQGLIGGDSALVYSPMEKTAYRGDLFQVQSMGLFPMDTDSPGLMLAMLGLLLPVDTDTLGIELSTDDRDYILHFGSGETVRVDPRGPVVSRWEKLDEGGNRFGHGRGCVSRSIKMSGSRR